jgi:hypothetical protein
VSGVANKQGNCKNNSSAKAHVVSRKKRNTSDLLRWRVLDYHLSRDAKISSYTGFATCKHVSSGKHSYVTLVCACTWAMVFREKSYRRGLVRQKVSDN